jgi:hypothetical protein
LISRTLTADEQAIARPLIGHWQGIKSRSIADQVLIRRRLAVDQHPIDRPLALDEQAIVRPLTDHWQGIKR